MVARNVGMHGGPAEKEVCTIQGDCRPVRRVKSDRPSKNESQKKLRRYMFSAQHIGYNKSAEYEEDVNTDGPEVGKS